MADSSDASGAGPADDDSGSEQVSSPTKLIRIASMVRTMLEEVRQAPLDEQSRRRLREIYERTMTELRDVLSDDLRDELDEMVIPFTADAPSESELRIAQAQLVGWLEGLFHGIQASLFQQQAAASAQLEEMRRRAALEAPSAGAQGPGGRGGPGGPGTGQYL
ncbi:MAG: bacterial proteasome activator family protein [Acidimicrobiia bacterium]|nr:bacterial proteasome activator family protein [Acidimicrobiia bacterium]